MATYTYRPADEIQVGDVLPDKSRWPVVTVHPSTTSIVFVHEGGFTWHAVRDVYGFPAVRIERAFSKPVIL